MITSVSKGLFKYTGFDEARERWKSSRLWITKGHAKSSCLRLKAPIGFL
jgi:hypothetical protein